MKLSALSATISLLILAATLDSIDAIDEVQFYRDVQPVLRMHCFRCHGSQQQEADLRLDRREDALAGGDSGELISAGDKTTSLLYQRITGLHGLDMMPPDSDPLSEKEIELIGQWIEEGAHWPDEPADDKLHWSYIAPQRSVLPTVSDSSWPANAIDHFVLSRLEQQGLAPSPEADKAKLLRRVYLDLIGLPPTVEAIDAYLADESPDAYEKVVDRLLASNHYGERWAVPWLDAARYADSNGYQADQYREVWPYRDWVVSAMNDDMPFDQFTIEQIAGDLLPDSTIKQKIATGFHRQATCNVEAGVDPEENRINQIFDRVNTTGTVWLGTSLECAQCHDHKYDPFDQHDYYQLFAYFNNTPLEVKHTTATTFDFYGPKLDVPLPENSTAEQRRLKKEFQSARDELDQYIDELTQDQPQWEADQLAMMADLVKSNANWQAARIIQFESSGNASHLILEDNSILVEGERPDKDTYVINIESGLEKIAAIKLDALTHPSLPGNGPGRHHEERPNFVLNELKLGVRQPGSTEVEPIKLLRPWADYSQQNFHVSGAIDGKPDTGWAIHQEFHQPHVATFMLLEPVTVELGQTLQVVLEQNHGGCRNLGRFRISFSSAEPPSTSLVDNSPPPEIAAILNITSNGRTETQQDQVVEYYRNAQPKYHELTKKVADLKKQLGESMSATTLVMTEMNDARSSSILKRGDFQTPLEQVSMGTPKVLHQPNSDEANRVELARWLVDRENPLTARVTVNRWWAEVFGQGIVTTIEDFGTQGEPPSHPQLLDWLAVELMENGWSMKHIHRLIVTSQTYRQSSRITADLNAKDPENRLLARGPRFRLAAEMIRDNGLAISGLLSTKLGGPPVFPPQPAGVWRHVGRNPPKYKVDEGPDRYRRGLYVVWRRSAPYPSFVNFDAPDRAACVVKRSRANTPLQALTLLNDEAYVEMAWALAARMAANEGTIDDRVRFGFRSCVAREPDAEESQALRLVFESELQRLREDSSVVAEMIGARRGSPDPAANGARSGDLRTAREPDDISKEELAAWFFVASILLNLDETITKG